MCLWGGINPEEDIERAAPRQIRSAVIDVLLAAGQGGGFVLSTGGSLYDPNCKDKVMSFIEAARALGRYPLDIDCLTAELAELKAQES
jgi:hypothetical protein